jgi:hypothetical protein
MAEITLYGSFSAASIIRTDLDPLSEDLLCSFPVILFNILYPPKTLHFT